MVSNAPAQAALQRGQRDGRDHAADAATVNRQDSPRHPLSLRGRRDSSGVVASSGAERAEFSPGVQYGHESASGGLEFTRRVQEDAQIAPWRA